MLINQFNDKFNVIISLSNDNRNYISIIKNYLENYFESGIYIYNIDYIKQIIWNNKIDIEHRKLIINEIIENILIHNRINIRKSIQKEMFDISSLNKLIMTYYNKLSNILEILNLTNDINKMFISKILLDPILVNYLENILTNIDVDTINDIKLLCKLLKENTNEFTWFLKLIGTVLKNNLVIITINIPEKYKIKYELNYIVDYIIKIKKLYDFTNDNIKIIIMPIYEILHNTIVKLISLSDTDELLRFIINKWNIIKTNIKCDEININKNIQKQIHDFIYNYLNQSKISDFNQYDNFYSILKLMIACININTINLSCLPIFNNENILNVVLQIIHNNIIIDVNLVLHIFKLLSNTSYFNKQYFFDKYHKLLIERLLSNNHNINNEYNAVNGLKHLLFEQKYIAKIIKVLSDLTISEKNMIEYNRKYNLKDFNTITTSYANWNINYNEGYVIVPHSVHIKHELLSCISHYQLYYKQIYNDMRKLIWLLQYGEVDIIYNKQEIKLLPIQLLVLELFNVKNIISINEIKSQSFFNNYSNKFKEDIINSLINGNILDKTINDMCLLSSNKNINSNLIDVYMNNNICIVTFDEVELAHTHLDIIKSVINHHIKIQPKTKEELLLLIQNDINQFKVTNTVFDDALNVMIKMDYILIEDDKYVKCIY
jgi:hypothetical protein